MFGELDSVPYRARAAQGRGGRRGRSARRTREPVARRRPETSPRRRTELQLLWLAIGGAMAVALLVWMGIGSDTPNEPPLPPPVSAGTGTATTGTTGTEVDPTTAEIPPDVSTAERTTIVLTGSGERGSYLLVHGRNSTGPKLYEGTLAPGESLSFTVGRSLWVRAGYTPGLLVTVDGEPREVEGGTANFIITKTKVMQVDAG
jgi:hypothetical protein